MWVPGAAQRQRRPRRRDRARQPLRLARSPWPAPRTAGCWSGRRSRAASRRTSTPRPGQGESSTDLSWDGQTMVYEVGDLLGETERFPDGPRRTTVDVDLDADPPGAAAPGHLRRQPRTRPRPTADFPTVEFTLDPPAGDIGLRRQVDRFPFVPDDAGAARAGLLRGLQHPGVRARAAAARDRQPEGGHRGVRRPRLDPRADRRGQGDGPARPAAQRHPRVHAAGLRDQRRHQGERHPARRRRSGSTFEEIDIRPAARQLLDDLDHPFSDGEPVYDVTFENVQAGLRTDYLFRLANHRGGIVLGTGDLSELALGWCTYGVGDQMSHYAVNTGVPKTLIQHLIRWVIGTGQFDAEVGAVLREILDQEISPELVPVAEGERPQSTEDAIGPYALQDFTLFHVLRHGFAPSRIAFLAQHAWSDADAGEWPPGFDADRPHGLRPADDPQVARGLRAAVLRVQPVQALGAAQRSEGASPAGRCRRAATGGRPRTATPRVWLDELAPQRPGGLNMANPLIQRRMHRIVRRSRDPSAAGPGGRRVRRDELAAALQGDPPRRALVHQPRGAADRHGHPARRRQLERHAHVQGQQLRPGDVVRGARARPEVLAVDRRDAPRAEAGRPAGRVRPGVREAPRRPGRPRRRRTACTTASTTTGSAGGRSARCSSRASRRSRCAPCSTRRG